MAQWTQHSKNVFTTEEMRDLEQFIAQAGGHIVGVVNAYKGVIVNYRLPIETGQNARSFYFREVKIWQRNRE